MLEVAIACLIITAVAAWINARFIHLPNTIGVMAIAMLLSLSLLVANHFGYGDWYRHERRLMESVDFSNVLMNGMLSILLFAGALHVDVSLLGKYRIQVATLALLGTAITSEQDMVRENGRWYGKDTMKALSDALDQPAASAEVAEEEVTEEPAPMEEDDEEVTE